MRKKGSSTAGQNSADGAKEIPWGGFIDIRLTDEQKAQFDEYSSKGGAAIWEDFEDTLGAGEKFALSYDETNSCFVASFSGTNGGSLGSRYVLTARSGSWEKAIHLLVFKHVVVLERDWGRFKPHTYGVEV